MCKEEIIKRLNAELWASNMPQNISSHIIEMAYQAGADNERNIIMARQLYPQSIKSKIDLYVVKSVDTINGVVTVYANELYAAKELNCDIKDIQQALRMKEVFNNCHWIPDTI